MTMEAVLLEEEVAQFLFTYPPFNLIPFDVVQQLGTEVKMITVGAGQTILEYGGAPSQYLYIIRQGSVDVLRDNGDGKTTLYDRLGVGDTFGHRSVLHARPPDMTARSREQTQLYLLPAPLFHQLRHEHPSFEQFFASSLERLTQGINIQTPEVSPEFQTRLRDVMQPIMTYVAPGTSVREAARLMREQGLECIIVDSSPPGLLTDRDLRNRVLAEGLSDATPVDQVMTSPIQTMPADSLVFEGLVTMLEQRVRHLPITENGRVIGVITHVDILRQQSYNPLLLPRQLMRARTTEDFCGYVDQVARTVGTLLAAGTRVQNIGRVVAASFDALQERLLRTAEAELGAPPCPYAWLVLGSQGRCEQLIHTDQDNAIIYADDAPPAAAEYFTALAEYVVEKLVACGFPRCPGDIMATNPRWRQPVRVWRAYFDDWIRTPDEEALMRAAIFFDYRRVYGQLDAEAALRPIIRYGRENKIFLTRLSQGALRQSPPIGFFRDFVVERNGAGQAVLDLKIRGTALIVDIARLFAIAADCADTNTISRLHLAAANNGMSREGAEELSAAFELISLLRLRHQYQQYTQGEQPTNQVEIASLTPLERRELKESLRAVGRMQRSVDNLFGSHWMG